MVVRTKNGECALGEVKENRLTLLKDGEIVDRCWGEIPDHFSNVELDEYVVMPNHVHGIIIIKSLVRAIHESPLPETDGRSTTTESPILRTSSDASLPQEASTKQSPVPGKMLPKIIFERRRMLIPKIVGRFKMNSAKEINEKRGSSGNAFWQREYHEQIIRDGHDLDRIRKYILDNPLNWESDDDHPHNIRMDRAHEGEGSWFALD